MGHPATGRVEGFLIPGLRIQTWGTQVFAEM